MSRFEARVDRLRREMAPRVKPLQLGPAGPAVDELPPAERAARLEQLRAQLLLGLPREQGPFPSRGMSELEASLWRAKMVSASAPAGAQTEFGRLEAAIAADPAVGPARFGADWPAVRHVFGQGSAPRRQLPALEGTDVDKWRRERWEAFLASPEGKAQIESGRLWPAARDDAGPPSQSPASEVAP